MAIKEFEVTYTQTLKVSIDTDKVDAGAMQEFSDMIFPVAPNDHERIAEYIGHNYVYNQEDEFFEGLGVAKELNLKIEEIDRRTEAAPWKA
jgi:uncharacterized protein YozE (UPF0346 family)